MSGEVILHEEQSKEIVLGGDIVALASQAEKRVAAMVTIKTCSLKITNPKDWVDQGGKPYLQVSGSEKIARLFNISWEIGTPDCEDYDDGHYMYSYPGKFMLGDASIEVIGTRCSRDGFFKCYEWVAEKEGGKKVKKLLPPSAINRGDVKKAALTNCLGNGITRLLGLRNMTYDDLKAAGIDTDQIDRVEYKTTEMSGDSKDLAAEIKRMLVEMYGEENFATHLCNMTEFRNKGGKLISGVRKLEGMSEGRIKTTYGKVKAEHEKRDKKTTQKAASKGNDGNGLEKTAQKVKELYAELNNLSNPSDDLTTALNLLAHDSTDGKYNYFQDMVKAKDNFAISGILNDLLAKKRELNETA